MELRKAGVPYSAIAERLGWNSPQAAHKAVQKAMKGMVQDSVEEAKQIGVERLQHLFMLAWAKAQNGDLRAIETCVRLDERIAAIRGLDAPRETNVHHSGVLIIEGESEDEYIASLSAIDGGRTA
jgi:hypothetical protein